MINTLGWWHENIPYGNKKSHKKPPISVWYKRAGVTSIATKEQMSLQNIQTNQVLGLLQQLPIPLHILCNFLFFFILGFLFSMLFLTGLQRRHKDLPLMTCCRTKVQGIKVVLQFFMITFTVSFVFKHAAIIWLWTHWSFVVIQR